MPSLALLAVLASPAIAAGAELPVNRSVVRIFTVFRQPDYYQPWQTTPQDSLSGSGCIIEGERILTNAHVVSNQVFIQVRKAGDPTRYTARVEFVAHDAELATLRVDDPAFFEDTTPLALGELPQQRDPVGVYGFPDGGDDLSVTEGIVSRVEVTAYAHSERELLAIQTDAAINPGNSGGPMVKDGRLVGVSFQMDEGAENIGYAVPAPIVARFLADIRDGSYEGVPDLGVRWQAVENPSFREWLGLSPKDTGVRLSAVLHGSTADGLLRPGDVLIAVDGVRISNDGTVPFRRNERVAFTHLLAPYQVGRKISLDAIREGKLLRVEAALRAPVRLVPAPAYGARPAFYIFAGLVFTPLTRDYINNWEWQNVSTAFKTYLEFGLPGAERRELVVLSHVLPDDVNVGYHDFRGLIIEKANGRPVTDLRSLIDALRAPQGRFHVLETDAFTDFGGRIVLDAARAERAAAGILARFGLSSDRSPGL